MRPNSIVAVVPGGYLTVPGGYLMVPGGYLMVPGGYLNKGCYRAARAAKIRCYKPILMYSYGIQYVFMQRNH